MSVEEEIAVVEEVEEIGETAEEEVAEEDAGDHAADEALHGSGEAVADVSVSGAYNAKEVNDQIFEELRLSTPVINDVQNCWRTYLAGAESRDAAGEAIYAALFDAAPSLQSLFKTPRAVMAMRFMNGLSQIINALQDPKGLKICVETLGFQHLDLEVTIPRVVIFRDAIVDLLRVELGARFTGKAQDGFQTFLNYVGGSYIFIRVKFSERLKILQSSWAQATNKNDEYDLAENAEGEGEGEGEKAAQTGEVEAEVVEAAALQAEVNKKKASKGKSWFTGKGLKNATNSQGGSAKEGVTTGGDSTTDFKNTNVPKTFDQMFLFNAAVMGFGNRNWMNEVMSSWDTIVTNVANSYRLQEECDVLSLRIAKYKGTIALPEYKSVMLASLRSLVKDWGSQHEVAWSWLWDNVERMIKALMGKPAAQEMALSRFLNSLDEKSLGIVRREVYAKFFALAPAGQDYFKQSTTRLHFIADKIVSMTIEIYKDPKRMVEDISALGLRHVGYGIPTDLFGPFVTACVQVVRMLSDDDAAEESFRWSLSLISRILTRVINEGSTIVMKAINQNSAKMMKKAISCAPRGKRAAWMLNIQVGTQAISPLMWAIETGSLEAAKAIIVDLLTIRADRDRYYYGMDIMFSFHSDIIKRLCLDAPALVPTLLDGLIWRSRTTENGVRRVNYYLKHLLVDEHGNFSKTLEWVIDNNDPQLVCHSVIAMVTDMVWGKVASRTFLYGRAWFVFTILVFVSSQAVLNHLDSDSEHGSEGQRIAIFLCRLFVYILSMGQWIIYHLKNISRDVKQGLLVRCGPIKVPEYLCQWQGSTSLTLTMFLVAMMCLEPILHCISDSSDKVFTQHCKNGDNLLYAYSLMSTGAVLAYFLLLLDLSVFSTRVSAFCLVCGRVVTEVALFLFGLTFFVLTFGCAISALEQENDEFKNIPEAALQLYKITFGMFSGTSFDKLKDEPALLAIVLVYVIVTIIFLINLLIAQLNCAYQSTYKDMLGYARLNRGKIVNDTMPSVASWRWRQFADNLRLEECVEFGEGDIGLAGGIQLTEPASQNITTVDMIKRFGGSTSPMAQWPEEENAGDDSEDRFDRMEKLIEKAMKRLTTKGGKKGGSGADGSSHDQSSDQQDSGVEQASDAE